MGKECLQREAQRKFVDTTADWLTAGDDLAKTELAITTSTQAKATVLPGL